MGSCERTWRQCAKRVSSPCTSMVDSVLLHQGRCLSNASPWPHYAVCRNLHYSLATRSGLRLLRKCLAEMVWVALLDRLRRLCHWGDLVGNLRINMALLALDYENKERCL